VRAERLLLCFFLSDASSKQREGAKEAPKQTKHRREKNSRDSSLSVVCLKQMLTQAFSAHKEFCKGGEKKKRKKKKEFVTRPTREKREQQKKRYRFNVKIFKERGARAYTLSSSSNARRKGLFSRFFLEKERRRRARGSVLGARFVKRERGRVSEWNARREEAKRQKNLSETCHHTNGTGNVWKDFRRETPSFSFFSFFFFASGEEVKGRKARKGEKKKEGESEKTRALEREREREREKETRKVVALWSRERDPGVPF